MYLGLIPPVADLCPVGLHHLFLLPFALLQYFAGRLTEIVGPYIPLLGGSAAYGLVLCAVGYSGGHVVSINRTPWY